MSPKIKKILSLILAVLLLCFNSQIVFAVTDEAVLYNFEYPVDYPNNDIFSYPDYKESAGPNVETLETMVDIDEFREHLMTYFAICPEFVNIKNATFEVICHPSRVSVTVGHKGCNKAYFKEKYNLSLEVKTSDTVGVDELKICDKIIAFY